MDDKSLDYGRFVRLVIDALEAANIEYLIGGAVAAWAWGEPRATMDLDLVVNIPLEAIKQLSEELGKRDMLVPEEIILDAILEDRADLPINAIHIYSGYKADLYPLRPSDKLRQSALQRRRRFDMGMHIGQVYLHSPEDLIIYKLLYYNLSQQTKHVRDITAIITTLKDELEFGYIDVWTTQLGLRTLWQELLRRVQAADNP
jgi:hypothetical protein